MAHTDAVPRPALAAADRATSVCSRCGRSFPPGTRCCSSEHELSQPAPKSGASRPDDPLVGQLIDTRYEVRQVLGQGGMGIVYSVRHTKLGRLLALKVLRSDLATDSNLCKRFIQEARAAAAVDHQGVVKITDFGVLASGQPYFVMELLHGKSLSRVMTETRPLALARMVTIIEQLVDALCAAHSVDVIHRDLKPDNIQVATDVTGRDSVKILDFGLARVAGASRLTKQGFVFGTPHYMSPEQAQGDEVDHRADIYALGVLMYEMATGQVPFDAESYLGVLTKHISTPPVRPSKLLGDRRLGALEPIILRCLEKRPAKRYSSMQELRAALLRAVHLTESGVHVAERRPLSVPPMRAARWPAFAAGAALSLGLGWWVVTIAAQHASAPPSAPSVTESRREVRDEFGEAARLEPGAGLVGSTVNLPARSEPATRARVRIDAVTPERPPKAASTRPRQHNPTPRGSVPSGSQVHELAPGSEIIDPWGDPTSQSD